MDKAQAPRGKITLLVIEAISLRLKSTASMKGIIKHVSGLIKFYIERKSEAKFQLTGEDSVVLLRDYLESLAERCRAVPAAQNMPFLYDPRR